MTITNDEMQTSRTFIIRPNRSMSREGLVVFFLAVCVVSMLLAVRFVILGAWLVLPFTLLEMLVLGVSLYLVERSSSYSEIITVNSVEILIRTQKGGASSQCWTFQPYWAKVVFLPDPKKWHPSKLFIQSHGKCIRVGACLTEADLESLAKNLKKSLAKYQGAF